WTGCPEEAGDVVGVVLPISVERDDTTAARRESSPKPSPERSPLPPPAIEPNDISPRPARHLGGVVGGPVVHDEHTSVATGLGDDCLEGWRLVKGRNDDQVIAHDRTRALSARLSFSPSAPGNSVESAATTRAVRQPPRAMPCTRTGPRPRDASRAAAATRRAPRPACCPNRPASDTGR